MAMLGFEISWGSNVNWPPNTNWIIISGMLMVIEPGFVVVWVDYNDAAKVGPLKKQSNKIVIPYVEPDVNPVQLYPQFSLNYAITLYF